MKGDTETTRKKSCSTLIGENKDNERGRKKERKREKKREREKKGERRNRKII